MLSLRNIGDRQNAGNRRMPSEEKRQYQRKLLQADAQIADLMMRSWTPIRLIDISAGGVAFATAESVAIDDIRTIEFSLPGCPARIRCEIKVANMLVNRLQEDLALGKYRIGATFDRIEASDVASIEQFVKD
jgi:hypothetical protein